jgi:benzoyl-CoA reductase/2-hydroxyglutaryl-CoA dehydratase subunit BcrC/BadD/HgdB
MNLIEREIARLERRLKKIDENPDQTRLKSNRLGYELELDLYREQLEAWQQGKPILPNTSRWPLMKALGLEPIVYPQVAQYVLSDVPKYRQIVQSLRIPEYSCDFMIYSTALAITGDIPPPSFIVIESAECSVGVYVIKMIGEHFGTPIFERDLPVVYNEKNIKYAADQLGELIEFAESKVPGVKYDRDRHEELLELERIGWQYRQKEWELKKHSPFPLLSQETMGATAARNPAAAPYPDKAIEFWRLRIEEIEERIAKDEMPQEKLRILWSWSRPLYMKSDILEKMQSRGAVVPTGITGGIGYQAGKLPLFGDDSEFGRKLSLFEVEAKMSMGLSGRQLGATTVEDSIIAAKEQRADAMIFFQFLGCVPVASLAKVIADRLEKELGIPTLIIGGSPLDPSVMPDAEFESRIMEFLDMVEAQKG